MFVIYVKNYKKKLILFSGITVLWVLMFLLGNFLMHNSLILNVTIDNYLTFSYPIEYEVDNIYINEQYIANTIETNSSLKKPLTMKFSSFKSLEGKFGFDYPSTYVLIPQDLGGGEILYHIDYRNKAGTARGFVQVWDLPYSLEEFLEKSEAGAQQNFKYFNTKVINVNSSKGYFWDYVILGSDSRATKGSEVFFEKDGRMYRISYFVPESLWNKTQSNIFWSIVNSFKTF